MELEERTLSDMDPEVTSLEYDSRRVQPNSLFFAVKGLVTDGHLYLNQVLERGAAAVTSEEKPRPNFSVPWIQVPAIRPCMARMANEFYGHPSEKLQLVGITGTNGKTTTAYLIHSVLKQEAPAVLMGTVKTVVGDHELESERTTPEAVDIQKTLATALERGCRWGAMEVSSHALYFHRVYECRFPVAVFTNLTQDHLDFHGTLEEYFEAKHLLFQHHYNPGLEYALINADNAFGTRVNPAAGARRIRFGFSKEAEIHPVAYSTSVRGTEIDLKFLGRSLFLDSPLVGEHNVYNIMAAATACSLLGISDRTIQNGVERLGQVPGRFEKVGDSLPFTVIVDYAHTPDALENVLRLCRKLARKRIFCIFGCGGDRDRAKRPVMGRIAATHADFTIITSDNPRSESPEKIVEEIRAGIPHDYSSYETIIDRKSAIARALCLAERDDIVLIAGKGHEMYQDIQGKKIHFDDREVVKALLCLN